MHRLKYENVVGAGRWIGGRGITGPQEKNSTCLTKDLTNNNRKQWDANCILVNS